MQPHKGMMSLMHLISRAQPRRPSTARNIQEPRPLALEKQSLIWLNMKLIGAQEGLLAPGLL